VKQQVISSPEDFDFLEDKTLMNEISIYREIASKYTEVSNQQVRREITMMEFQMG